MTIVSELNYLAEDFVYLFLNGSLKCDLRNKTLHFCDAQTFEAYYQNLTNACEPYRNVLFPNKIKDPRTNNQNEWFDMQDENLGINVKYGYDSSANARIRDLTKGATIELNKFILEKELMPIEDLYDYDKLRNKFLKKIGEDVKKKNFPIVINENEGLYIKLAYLICMNFIGASSEIRNVFFFKFKKNGEVSIFASHLKAKAIINFQDFINRTTISFSGNTLADPHKQTIKLFIEGNPIGFFELRSNGRVMLHLRVGNNHWQNLINYCNQ